MKHTLILKFFIKFLKKEKIYDEYLYYLMRGQEYRLRCSTIKERDEKIWLVKTIKSCPHRLIMDAFRWNDINIQWGEIDLRWKDFYYDVVCKPKPYE